STTVSISDLIDQADRKRIAIERSFARFDRRDDDKYRIQYPKRDQNRNADKHEAENCGNRVVNQHGNLEIERFFSVRVDLGRVATFHQPGDERAEKMTQEMKKQSGQVAGMSKHSQRPEVR